MKKKIILKDLPLLYLKIIDTSTLEHFKIYFGILGLIPIRLYLS
jgi:hypothetical protein